MSKCARGLCAAFAVAVAAPPAAEASPSQRDYKARSQMASPHKVELAKEHCKDNASRMDQSLCAGLIPYTWNTCIKTMYGAGADAPESFCSKYMTVCAAHSLKETGKYTYIEHLDDDVNECFKSILAEALG